MLGTHSEGDQNKTPDFRTRKKRVHVLFSLISCFCELVAIRGSSGWDGTGRKRTRADDGTRQQEQTTEAKASEGAEFKFSCPSAFTTWHVSLRHCQTILPAEAIKKMVLTILSLSFA